MEAELKATSAVIGQASWTGKLDRWTMAQSKHGPLRFPNSPGSMGALGLDIYASVTRFNWAVPKFEGSEEKHRQHPE